jgi:hypothetical protein
VPFCSGNPGKTPGVPITPGIAEACPPPTAYTVALTVLVLVDVLPLVWENPREAAANASVSANARKVIPLCFFIIPPWD